MEDSLTLKQQNVLIKAKEWWDQGEEYRLRKPFVLSGIPGCIDKYSYILTDIGHIKLKDIILSSRNDLDFIGNRPYTGSIKVFNGEKFTDISYIHATDVVDGYEVTLNNDVRIKCSDEHLFKIKMNNDFKWQKITKEVIGKEIQIYIGSYTSCNIKSITHIKQKFYDITVPEKNQYIANGIVSHNSGKTYISKRISEELNIFEENVKFVAYTGAAAGMLSKKGLEATTVHKLIYNPASVERTDEETGRKWEEIIFNLKSPEDFEKVRLIIIDEASMIDMELFKDIKTFQKPIILLGDKNQLPPPNNNESLYKYLQNPDFHLDEPIRQNEDSYIFKLSKDIIEGNGLEYGTYNGGEVKIIRKDELDIDYMQEVDQVLAGKNITVQSLNKLYRKKFMGISDPSPINNDKVICLKNNWSREICENGIPQSLTNGLIGHVSNIQKLATLAEYDSMTFKPSHFKETNFNEVFFDRLYFEKDIRSDDYFYQNYKDYKGLIYKRKNLMETLNFKIDKFNYAYAITVYKSQGNEFDSVLYIDEFLNKKIYLNHIYTAVTRAKKKLIIAI